MQEDCFESKHFLGKVLLKKKFKKCPHLLRAQLHQKKAQTYQAMFFVFSSKPT